MQLYMRAARGDEFDRVRAFYYDLIVKMQGSPYHPKWQIGIYPEDSYLQRAVEAGQMYLACCEDQIVGAMILNQSANAGYEGVCWPVEAKDSEVMLIHTLGVLPEAGKQGVGGAMVQEAIRLAREAGMKALRLDVLVGNLPAEKLYRKAGFSFVQRVELFYEDTGWCSFDLYEYPL